MSDPFGSEAMAQMFDLSRQIADAPPVVSRCIATHSVPYGRVFRMWTTRGELIVYVNRGEVADLPRAKAKPEPFAFETTWLFGIPVYVE